MIHIGKHRFNRTDRMLRRSIVLFLAFIIVCCFAVNNVSYADFSSGVDWTDDVDLTQDWRLLTYNKVITQYITEIRTALGNADPHIRNWLVEKLFLRDPRKHHNDPPHIYWFLNVPSYDEHQKQIAQVMATYYALEGNIGAAYLDLPHHTQYKLLNYEKAVEKSYDPDTESKAILLRDALYSRDDDILAELLEYLDDIEDKYTSSPYYMDPSTSSSTTAYPMAFSEWKCRINELTQVTNKLYYLSWWTKKCRLDRVEKKYQAESDLYDAHATFYDTVYKEIEKDRFFTSCGGLWRQLAYDFERTKWKEFTFKTLGNQRWHDDGDDDYNDTDHWCPPQFNLEVEVGQEAGYGCTTPEIPPEMPKVYKDDIKSEGIFDSAGASYAIPEGHCHYWALTGNYKINGEVEPFFNDPEFPSLHPEVEWNIEPYEMSNELYPVYEDAYDALDVEKKKWADEMRTSRHDISSKDISVAPADPPEPGGFSHDYITPYESYNVIGNRNPDVYAISESPEYYLVDDTVQVGLSEYGSSDADGDELYFRWVISYIPEAGYGQPQKGYAVSKKHVLWEEIGEGSTASFTPDLDGIWKVRLEVYDGFNENWVPCATPGTATNPNEVYEISVNIARNILLIHHDDKETELSPYSNYYLEWAKDEASVFRNFANVGQSDWIGKPVNLAGDYSYDDVFQIAHSESQPEDVSSGKSGGKYDGDFGSTNLKVPVKMNINNGQRNIWLYSAYWIRDPDVKRKVYADIHVTVLRDDITHLVIPGGSVTGGGIPLEGNYLIKQWVDNKVWWHTDEDMEFIQTDKWDPEFTGPILPYDCVDCIEKKAVDALNYSHFFPYVEAIWDIVTGYEEAGYEYSGATGCYFPGTKEIGLNPEFKGVRLNITSQSGYGFKKPRTNETVAEHEAYHSYYYWAKQEPWFIDKDGDTLPASESGGLFSYLEDSDQGWPDSDQGAPTDRRFGPYGPWRYYYVADNGAIGPTFKMIYIGDDDSPEGDNNPGDEDNGRKKWFLKEVSINGDGTIPWAIDLPLPSHIPIMFVDIQDIYVVGENADGDYWAWHKATEDEDYELDYPVIEDPFTVSPKTKILLIDGPDTIWKTKAIDDEYDYGTIYVRYYVTFAHEIDEYDADEHSSSTYNGDWGL